MDTWQTLMHQVEAHHGVVLHRELVAAGIAPRTISRLLGAGRLVRMHQGTYRVAGAPATFEARAAAAVRELGEDGLAWVARCSAAELWGLRLAGPDTRIEILRPDGTSAGRGGVLVHRSTRILPHHVTVRRGLPITTPSRTLFDVARATGPRRLARVVSEAIHDPDIPCSLASLYRVLYDLGGRGRPGTRRLRQVLDEHHTDEPPTESVMDELGRALLRDVPGIEFQVEMSDAQGYIRRLDALVRPARLALEFDGARFHASPAQRRSDRDGDRRLRAAFGIVTRRLDWDDLARRGDLTHAEIMRSALPAAG